MVTPIQYLQQKGIPLQKTRTSTGADHLSAQITTDGDGSTYKVLVTPSYGLSRPNPISRLPIESIKLKNLPAKFNYWDGNGNSTLPSSEIVWPANFKDITTARELMDGLIKNDYPKKLAQDIAKAKCFSNEQFPLINSLKNRLSQVACPDLPSLLYFIKQIHLESGKSEFDIDKLLTELTDKIKCAGPSFARLIKIFLEERKLTTLEEINDFFKNLKPLVDLN